MLWCVGHVFVSVFAFLCKVCFWTLTRGDGRGIWEAGMDCESVCVCWGLGTAGLPLTSFECSQLIFHSRNVCVCVYVCNVCEQTHTHTHTHTFCFLTTETNCVKAKQRPYGVQKSHSKQPQSLTFTEGSSRVNRRTEWNVQKYRHLSGALIAPPCGLFPSYE